MDFSFLRSSADLTEDHFAEAAETREDTYELLLRMAELSEPHDGTSARLIRFLARVAIASHWVDGDVRIKIEFSGVFRTRVILLRGLGGDEFEVLKRLELAVSFMEFRGACEETRAIQPFIVSAANSTGKDMHIVLDAPERIRRSSIPPPEFTAAQARLALKLQAPQIPRLKPEVAAALEKIRRLRDETENAVPPPAAPTVHATPIAKIQLAKRRPDEINGTAPPASGRNPESLLPLIRSSGLRTAPNEARQRTQGYGTSAANNKAPDENNPIPVDDLDDGWDED